jgi:PLP dependent protein
MSGSVKTQEDLIRERLDVVRGRIAEASRRSGREPEEVRILVASKYYALEQMAALADAGVELLGENRAEDLLEKQERFGDAFEWHFIGHLQRRKAKDVVPRVTLIHSIDSVKLIGELAKRASEGRVRARGFTTLAPIVERAEDVRYVFTKLQAIRDRLKSNWSPHFDLSELSMGMSNDYWVAVEEGATIIRIGRALIEDSEEARS